MCADIVVSVDWGGNRVVERLRLFLAVLAARLIRAVNRRFHLGGGTSLPGRVALKIAPNLIASLTGQLPRGSVVITGTNGKTTTAKLLHSILRASGARTVYNGSGANLTSGVASALLEAADLRGRLNADLGILEVDENAFPTVARQAKPAAVVVTNFFRDQLDRYGEIDHTVATVRKALTALPSQTAVWLNADDPLVAGLGEELAHDEGKGHDRPRIAYYGVEDESIATTGIRQVPDARYCARCGRPVVYERVFYGHLGWYFCGNCDYRRPEPRVYARAVEVHGREGTRLEIVLPSETSFAAELKIPGFYNVYNALAAVAAATTLGAGVDAVEEGLGGAQSAFGRMEKLEIAGRDVVLALVKNPTGFNATIQALLADDASRHCTAMFALNDRSADGEDVSWIWDVDLEALAREGSVRSIMATGLRAEDMAVRLKYAGFAPNSIQVEKDLARALEAALGLAPEGGTVYVLPTYTAMLGLRQLLEEQGRVRRYWEA